MKIVFILNEFPVLSETFVINQIIGLIKLGHDVDILAFGKPSADEKIHKDVLEFNLLDRVVYFEIPQNRFSRIFRVFGIFCFPGR